MTYEDKLTHFNKQDRAKMVDISDKQNTVRMAVAKSQINMLPETLNRIKAGNISKGDVLAVAQIAGVMAAKKTSEIIPMCHPLFLTGIDIIFDYFGRDILTVEAIVKTSGNTGVEMEALTAVSVATLTVYDMCKAMDKEMVIGPTYLQSKSGGKSGDFHRSG
ncbi:cyclic pyranopterin monophosphate synthase MoaC [Brevibacillus sp. SYSU BS000544]|uniref:cyclic pyranopterin monophosphate synthase MoaC n=1 Tax=Brevibacillus sp. SYSU BS000544 TaxID=3416443 RepID=UPI003CE486FE